MIKLRTSYIALATVFMISTPVWAQVHSGGNDTGYDSTTGRPTTTTSHDPTSEMIPPNVAANTGNTGQTNPGIKPPHHKKPPAPGLDQDDPAPTPPPGPGPAAPH